MTNMTHLKKGRAVQSPAAGGICRLIKKDGYPDQTLPGAELVGAEYASSSGGLSNP